jgi:hypothetical protein
LKTGNVSLLALRRPIARRDILCWRGRGRRAPERRAASGPTGIIPHGSVVPHGILVALIKKNGGGCRGKIETPPLNFLFKERCV